MAAEARIFETKKQANAAMAKLAELDMSSSDITLLSPPSKKAAASEEGEDAAAVAAPSAGGNAAAEVAEAVERGHLPGRYINLALRNLEQGRSVLALNTPLGRGRIVLNALEECGAVETDSLPPFIPSDSAPLSDFLGIPVLTKGGTAAQLASSSWSFSSLFGLGLLSNKAAPLSSMFGMKTLSESKEWKSSMGMPLLSGNPAPLSSTVGFKTVTESKEKTRSFGLPLLAKNPAPLSWLIGLPTLIGASNSER